MIATKLFHSGDFNPKGRKMARIYRIDEGSVVEQFTEALLIEKRYCCLIKGPFGSGKSVGCIESAYMLSLTQPPINGKRFSRFAFVRNTKSQLKDTTIETFFQWFPNESPGHMHWTDLKYTWEDGQLHMEIWFLALDTPDDVRKLLSLELTGVFLNEAREIDKDIIEGIDGRVGRYPSRSDLNPVLQWKPDPPTTCGRYYLKDAQDDGSDDQKPWELVYVRGGRKGVPLTSSQPLKHVEGRLWAVAPWSGIVADTNPYDDDAYICRIFEVEASVPDSPAFWKYSLFTQPPGLVKVQSADGTGEQWATNPKAENLRNLPAGYYTNLAVGKSINYIRMYCLGQNAVMVDGKPVFTQFDDAWHVADFKFDPALPIYVGWDFGVNGQACVLAQLSARGQLRVMEEFVGPAGGLGFYQFAKDIVKPGLAKYKGATFAMSWGDPAGSKRADTDERHSMGILNGEYPDMDPGLPFSTHPSDTNSLQPRLDSVTWFLANNLPKQSINDAMAPRFLLHPRCKLLRRGFNGKYHYKRVQVSEERYLDVPNKNEASHPHDSLQYVARGLITHFQFGQKTDQDDEPQQAKPRRKSGYSGY